MKKKNKLSKLNKYFLLNFKKILFIIGGWIIAVVLHNLIYALFKSYFDSHGGDEPFFFILAVIIIPLYFLSSLIYTLVIYLRKK